MLFRWTLNHDESETSQEINEPDGWEGGKLVLVRDKDYMSLVENFEGSANGAFVFYGANDEVDGGVNFLKEKEVNFGFDTNIDFIVEVAPDEVNYQEVFRGLVSLQGKNEMPDNKMQAPVIRDDFWTKFFNRRDIPVSLSSLTDIDGNTVDAVEPVTVTLTDQLINQYFVGFLPEATYSFGAGVVGNGYIQLDFDDKHTLISEAQKALTIDEIDEHVSGYPIIDNPEQPSPSFDFEFPGDVVVNDLTVIARHLTDDTTTHLDADIKGYIFDGTTEHLLTRTDYLGSDGTTRRSRFVYTGTISDAKSLAIYLKNDSGSTSSAVGLLFDDQVEIGVPATYTTKFDFYLISEFAQTQAQGYLIHDLIHGVLARMGLGTNPFYSDFLGATYTNSAQYDNDGCGAMYAILKGLQIRGYTLTAKPFFISFKDIWDGIHPILNLGLGYDTVVVDASPEHPVIRIEQKSFFLDDDTSINFSNVRDISCSYDSEHIFSSIKTGYKQWQSEDKSGLDDYGNQTRATPISTGKPLNIESGFIASGLVIEKARRTNRFKNEDYKHDNSNFIIAISTSDVSPDFSPELIENFTTVGFANNPTVRYNWILSPLRNFLRWANSIGGCMQSSYSTSPYTFQSGEGNYGILTDYNCAVGNVCQAIICESVFENSDIDLLTYNDDFGYDFLPLVYRINIPMEWEEYETINDNRTKAIGISQTTVGHVAFKIKHLEYDYVLGQATIQAWPKTFLNIQVIDQEFEMECSTPPTPVGFSECYQDILDYGEDL